MAAPNDPKDKPKVTLDLDLKQTSSAESKAQTRSEPKLEIKLQPKQPSKLEPKQEAKAEPKQNENSQINFRQLDATVKRPEKPQSPAPKGPVRPIQNRSRSAKGKKNPNTSKPLFVAAGLLIVGVLALQFFAGRGDLPLAETTKPAPKMAAKAPKAVPTESLPQTTPAPEPAGDPYGGLREANLDQLAPEVDDDGNTFFAVRIAPKKVCFPADVEAMRNVVGNAGSLLLSLEPTIASGKAKAPISRTISLKEITQGTKVSLPVNLKETGVYGIYICSDEAGKRSCSDKPAADFNKILNHRDLNIAANAVFYYQFTVLGLDYATVYSGLPSNIGEAREELAEQRPKKDWKPELEKAASMMRDVKSFPPRTVREGNTIVLELPVAMVNPDGSCR